MVARDERIAAAAPEGETSLAVALAAEDPTTRRGAVDRFGALAEDDVDAATAHVDAVARRLTDDRLAVARGAAEALEPVARERPGALGEHLDSIVELLAADSVDLSVRGAQLLSPLAVATPDAVGAHADRPLAILAADAVPQPDTAVPESVDRAATRELIRTVQRESLERRQFVRRTAVNVVVAAVESDPTHLGSVEPLESLLDDPDPGVAGPAVDALGTIAESDPDAVRPALPALLECLDRDRASMRLRTIRALGYLGDESAVPALREVAADADDEDVAELATETATFLAAE